MQAYRLEFQVRPREGLLCKTQTERIVKSFGPELQPIEWKGEPNFYRCYVAALGEGDAKNKIKQALVSRGILNSDRREAAHRFRTVKVSEVPEGYRLLELKRHVEKGDYQNA